MSSLVILAAFTYCFAFLIADSKEERYIIWAVLLGAAIISR